MVYGLDGNRVEKLCIRHAKFPLDVILKMFRGGGGCGLKFLKLKSLKLDEMLTKDLEGDRDVAEYINLLIDTCSFPELEELDLEFHNFNAYFSDYGREEEESDDDTYYSDDDRPAKPSRLSKWLQSPRTTHPFPKLTLFKLRHVSLSRSLGDYLANFHTRPGCRLEVSGSDVDKIVLPEHREQLLRKLGINIREWERCMEDSISDDLLCWNILSDEHFQLSTYAAALITAACKGPCRDDVDADTGSWDDYGYDYDYEDEQREQALENLVEMIENDVEEGMLTEAVVEPLRKLLEKLDFDRVNDSEFESLVSWVLNNARRLIDSFSKKKRY